MAVYTRGRARRSLIDTMTFRAVSQVATVLGYVVMVRGMAKVDFGVYNLLYAFIPVVSTAASLGLEQTLRRYQPEYLRTGNLPAANWLVRFIASARFGANVVILGAILLTWNYCAPIFKLEPYRTQFIIFGVLLLFHFQCRILQLSLASHMLHRFSVGSMALVSLVKLAGYAALVFLHELTLDAAILVDILAYALSFLGMRVMYHRHCRAEETAAPWRPPKAERKRMLRYGFYNNFNDAGTMLLTSKTDNFYIAAFIDPIAVGVYAFYTRLNEMMGNLQPVRLFENVIHPIFFAIPAGEADARVKRYFTLLVNMNLMLQWPMLAFSVAYHSEIVAVIFGGKFIESSWLLPVIVGFATINVIGTPATLVAQYEEKAGIILWSKIFALYNVAALLVMVPPWGLYGAAVASGSAQAMKNLFIWWYVRHRAVWINAGSALTISFAIWGGAVALCLAIKQWLHLPALVNLLVGAGVCGLAALLHLRSGAISSSDRNILGSVLHGREARILGRLGLLARGESQEAR